MLKYLGCLFIFFCTSSLSQNVLNGGFENPVDSLPDVPSNWKIRKTKDYRYLVDTKTLYAGKQSFRIESTPEIDSNASLAVSQAINIDEKFISKIALTVFIKTDAASDAGVFCQILDGQDKLIGFENLQMQGVKIAETSDWKKYSLSILVDRNTKKLAFGAYIKGAGKVWFDDFALEKAAISKKAASNAIKKFSTELTTIVKSNSIYSDSLDWKVIEKEMQTMSKGLANIEDAAILSQYMLGKLRQKGDHHSLVINKSHLAELNNSNTDNQEPYAKIIDSTTAYVFVPGISSFNDTVLLNFATKLQNEIKAIDNQYNITGWIVDLRENTGGNMYPMLAGLGPLLGEGTLGYFVNPANNHKSRWYYLHGAAGEDSSLIVKVTHPYTLKNGNSKIAVLIGENTCSSGEMTAIAFIGKPNAKNFGLESAGYTTANEGYKLSDGSELYLASAFTADRNSKIIFGKIHPDVLVENKNTIIPIAKQWINQK